MFDKLLRYCAMHGGWSIAPVIFFCSKPCHFHKHPRYSRDTLRSHTIPCRMAGVCVCGWFTNSNRYYF
jgi:hypothetical protein